MEWCDLSELREAASSYCRLLTSYSFTWNDQDTNARINRLHDAIANIKINEIGDVLERFNVNQSLIIHEVENIISIVECLISEIGMKMPKVKPYDPGVAEVFKFCKELLSVMDIELTKLRMRIATDPTMGDEDAGQRLMSFLNGDYDNMDFQMFYNNYLIADRDYHPDTDYTIIVHARRRRLNYLISICPGYEIKTIMNELVDGVQHEIDTYNYGIPFDAPEPPGNEQAAQPPLPPSAEATTTDDAQPSPKVDADRLGSFFNAKFKGAGSNPDRIKDLVNDIEKIKVTKELAMIAVMIYDCRQYFIRKPSTFAAWLREFFNIIGRDCPKDTHKNKYKPDERIERLFYYLK